MSAESFLLMDSIVKTFSGVQVLNKVSLRVRSGTVHALMGENGAGKSTLMKILGGIYDKDSGEIFINGNSVHIDNPRTAQNLGISMIHQELSSLPDLTVAANVFLGREPVGKYLNIIDKKKMRTETKSILDEIGAAIDPDVNVRELSVAEAQLVEIAKAISYNSDIIVMDEPTSAITDTEIDKLFNVIRKLKNEGKAIIYISHKMDEIFQIADEITVLRDGQLIGTELAEKLNPGLLISMMVGRELNHQYAAKTAPIGDIIFEARNLTRKNKFKNINFAVRKGEILGIAGLMGAGRTEIVESIFGIEKLDSGEIFIDGKRVKITSPRHAIKHGLALVPEDRKLVGLNLVGSIKENITIANLKMYCLASQIIRRTRERTVADDYIKRFSIKTPNADQLVNRLSGGNQQKVVLSRWMSCNPHILIMDEPTRGIDVGAKSEIYKLMCDYAERGNAVIMISSELPEIMGMSDRTIVIHEGVLTGEFSKDNITQEAVMICASGLNERGSLNEKRN